MSFCASCGNQNGNGAKFCAQCGRALALACPSCGHAYAASDRFCSECGTELGGASPAPPAAAPVAERRLVSVLFADLVGFTTFSERRDPEEVRELLSRYFETCSRLIELYGGIVEKFIGDAVMAVWAHRPRRRTAPSAEEALTAALACLDGQSGTAPVAVFSAQQGKQAFPVAVETLLALGRRGEAEQWMARYDAVPIGLRPPFVQAHAHRLRGLVDGDPAGFARSAAAFEELRIPFWAAVARLEQAEHTEAGDDRERLLASARAEFERLGARPWLERANAAGVSLAASA